MKTIFALAGTAIVVCSLAAAGSAERVVVPAPPGGHARQVNVHVLNNSITVKTNGGSEVVVEAGSHPAPSAGGMRRIDGPRGLTIDEADNEGTINGGGVPVSFHTLHGTIYLRKKK